MLPEVIEREAYQKGYEQGLKDGIDSQINKYKQEDEFKECCLTCDNKLDLKKLDYSHGGCKHTKLEGFCCLVFASEGQANWMVGINPEEGICEDYEPHDCCKPDNR